MIQISKEQADYLIKNGFLKSFKGKYQDLTITCRDKKSCRKKHYVSRDIAKFLPKVEIV